MSVKFKKTAFVICIVGAFTCLSTGLFGIGAILYWHHVTKDWLNDHVFFWVLIGMPSTVAVFHAATMKRSPTWLSLDFLNKCGWVCQIVEKRLPIPGKFVTQDCFGIADILAYHPQKGVIALIQTTSATNFMARKSKVLASPHLEPWKRAGGLFYVQGWGKNGLREEQL